jgi:hypothetical protein
MRFAVLQLALDSLREGFHTDVQFFEANADFGQRAPLPSIPDSTTFPSPLCPRSKSLFDSSGRTIFFFQSRSASNVSTQALWPKKSKKNVCALFPTVIVGNKLPILSARFALPARPVNESAIVASTSIFPARSLRFSATIGFSRGTCDS